MLSFGIHLKKYTLACYYGIKFDADFVKKIVLTARVSHSSVTGSQDRH